MGLLTSIHGGQGRRLYSVMWTSTYQVLPGHYWALNLSVAETNTEFLVWYHSLGWSANYLEEGWLHWTTYIMEEIITLEKILTLDTNLFVCNISYRMLYLPSWYSIQHCFYKSRNSLYIQWSVAAGPCPWNSLFLPCSPPSWISWLAITVEQHFEASFIAPARKQYLTELVLASPGGSLYML